MILVDTTVWVDFFAGVRASHVAALESFLSERRDVCICGVILTEVLQGIRDDQDYVRTKAHLDALLFLPMTHAAFVRAADIYRSLRRRGITIRKPLDCTIAAVAVECGASLLHNDRDFDPIERHCGLRAIRAPIEPSGPTSMDSC